MAKKKDMITTKNSQALMEYVYSAKKTVIHGDVKDCQHVILFKGEELFMPETKNIKDTKFSSVEQNTKGIFLIFAGWQSAAEMIGVATDFINYAIFVIIFPLRYISLLQSIFGRQNYLSK